MKTAAARNTSGDDWKTPDDFYNKLDEVYHFNFDPCPYQADFDGLSMDWGGETLLIRRIQESLKNFLLRRRLKKAGRENFAFCYFR